MRRHSDNRKDQDSQPEYLMNNPEIMGIKKDYEHPQNESNDMTEIINNETESGPYNIDERSKKFIRFCGERRSLRKIRPGRLKLISENGEQYASIQCKAGDCPENETERNELWLRNYIGESKNDDFEFNKPYTCKFSFRIPENFPLSPTRLVIGQWKFNRQDESEEKGPSPILAQRIKKIDGKYYLVVTDSHREQIGEKIPFDDIKGKWVDMEYKINFSDKEGVESSVEIVANIEGKKVNIFKGSYEIRDEENKLKLNPDKPHTGYFKFGLYRDSYDYAIKKLKKDSKLSRKEKKIGIQEIEKAQSSESENPMEIHFKKFSMEDDTQPEIERLKGKLNDEQHDKVEYLTRLFKKGDIDEIYSKFLKLDKDYIDYIKNHEESKDISKELEFLQDPNYIENTKNEYKELFEKVKADKDISKLLEAIEKQDTEQIISLEKDIRNLRKKLKKLKKYEKGELINLPNGLSFELSTKQEEKTISENIKLGDDEYFIKTHVERNADYKQYVSSLLEMRKLFKNKGINIKYVKRSTWLVNKEFLKAYEQEFLIPKYGDKYKKIQSIKVLDDTASAEIFYQIKEGTNPYDEKDEKKSPLRFIKDKKDLLGYVTQDDEHLKSFNEAEMWLDLDKLSQEKQDGGNSSTEKSTNNNSEEQIKEKLPSSEQIEQEYAEVLVKLIGNDENFKELLEGKHELSIKDIENIYNALHGVRSNSKKEYLKDGKESEQDFDNLKKFCFDPKAIEKYKIFNCSGGSLMMASIINKLGGQATIASVYHHVVCIAQIGGKQYIIDTMYRGWEDITGKGKITDTEHKGVSKFTVKKPLLGRYTEGYIYDSIAQGEKYIHGSNYEQMKTEKEYEKTYKEIKDLLEEKLDTYPAIGDKNYPTFIAKKNFPEFDKKIYEIEHDKLPKAGFFGKIKLKVQRLFLKLKQFFNKK